jgi:hypothetical protein
LDLRPSLIGARIIKLFQPISYKATADRSIFTFNRWHIVTHCSDCFDPCSLKSSNRDTFL